MTGYNISITGKNIQDVIMEGIEAYYKKYGVYPGRIITFPGAIEEINNENNKYIFNQMSKEADQCDQRLTLQMETHKGIIGAMYGIPVYEDLGMIGRCIIFERT